MQQDFSASNQLDADGKPAGGFVSGKGLSITWQDGPLGRGAERLEPNGAFVETVIAAAEQRLQWYNASGFACDENTEAIGHLHLALAVLNSRTARREAAGVEGTHEGT